VTSVKRSRLVSKSKIPPQLSTALCKIGDLAGEGVQAFGFHGIFRCEENENYTQPVCAGRACGVRKRCRSRGGFSTIITRERALRAAARTGLHGGVGHTIPITRLQSLLVLSYREIP
jgi:hypothetical protein